VSGGGERRSVRRLIVVLGSLSAFGPLSMDMYLPGLPALTRGLHASASAGQLTLTGCMVGLALGQLIAGPVSDSLGRRSPLLAGVAGYGLASLACAAAPSVPALIALRFVQGLCGGAGLVIARAIVRDHFHGAVAARMFAALMIVNGAAPILAPLIGGQVLRVTSWRGVFLVLGAIGALLLVVTLRGLPETLPRDRRHGGGLRATAGTLRRLSRDRRFMPYAASFSLSFAALFAYIAGSSFVLENIHGVSPQTFSLVFATNSVGLIAAAQIGARALTRASPALLLRFGLGAVALAGSATLVVVATHGALVLLLVSLFVLASGNGLVVPNGTASAMAEQPQALGSASALLGVGQFGCGAIVAPLVGLAGSHDALPMAIVIAVCALSAFAIDAVWAPPPVAAAVSV
jgi:MFS transporter, DHA1 family, multidrug resistance protein